MTDFGALTDRIAGEVLLPGTPAYDGARRPPIVRFRDVRPQAVVRCASAADVAEAIAFARAAGLPTATRSGGHCFEGRSSTVGVLIDVGPIDAVSVEDGAATIGAGARLGRVYDALDRHGLTIAAGCGPEVGIAGLVLGGGLGILGRAHGLTADSLLGADVVLADGSAVTCDAERHADLFWALRGAGHGGFGVVTAFRFRTLPAPPATAFRLRFGAERAAALVAAWQAWAPDAPGELAASLLVTAPGEPGAPLEVAVIGAMAGTEAETAAELARLGAEPTSATLRHGPFRAAKRFLSGLGGDERPVRLHSRSEYFARPLPPEAVAELVEALGADRAPGEARELDFSPWGGAYTRPAGDATAFAHRDARFLLKHGIGLAAGASDGGWLDRSWAIAHPHGTGGAYPNFPDPRLEDPRRAYHGANLERLRRVKAAYDPDGVFPFP